jgi:diguanylate cyclase (GGDEF)-like protein
MTEKPSILIVDDNPDNIRVLGTILRQNNYRVIIAQSGLQALKILEMTPADLILLDIMMPELNGFETCQRLKNNPDSQSIPVIFVTAKVEEADIIQGFTLGAVDYITKPFSPPVLLARVKTHIELHQYHKLLQEQAYIDGLTQIPNRLQFEKVLLNEWNRALRTHSHLAVLMIDIDFFKVLNDSYGHLVGDQVLKQVAGSINSLVKRSGDFVARYGGEEFVVILPHSGLKEATHLAENIRCEIEALQIENKNTALRYITLSLGVASLIPEHSLSPMLLVDKADQQLYLAKNNGRNQVQAAI